MRDKSVTIVKDACVNCENLLDCGGSCAEVDVDVDGIFDLKNLCKSLREKSEEMVVEEVESHEEKDDFGLMGRLPEEIEAYRTVRKPVDGSVSLVKDILKGRVAESDIKNLAIFEKYGVMVADGNNLVEVSKGLVDVEKSGELSKENRLVRDILKGKVRMQDLMERA